MKAIQPEHVIAALKHPTAPVMMIPVKLDQ
jgi:hypothetical protein